MKYKTSYRVFEGLSFDEKKSLKIADTSFKL